MVNFALALIPDETLQATIDKFFKTQWHNTLNQRAYTALASRPAPLFIETRTTSSTADRSKVQLGIWVAAWYQRLRDANSAKNPTSIALMQYVGTFGMCFSLLMKKTILRLLTKRFALLIQQV
ncbi:hypothetical protein FOWG_11979 [Fusarium oxysporum f. sp. lycopersici MN25]|nr:hypothetical protein FOWG_11979 [Fusarium oxysporum f. sp. lycopersici MN25]